MIQKKEESMEAKKSKAAPTRPIRWHDADWALVGEVAKSVGLSRSAFVKRAALLAAAATAAGLPPYFVSEAKATPQNTRINLFLTEGKQKLAAGGGQDAADCSRSDCAAKGGPTSDLPVHKLNELTDGKA